MGEHLKTGAMIGLLFAAVWGLTRIPGTCVNYHYECIKLGKVQAERCVAEESKHVLDDASGNCMEQALVSMSGSDYCHRCEQYETVEEDGCVEWKRVAHRPLF